MQNHLRADFHSQMITLIAAYEKGWQTAKNGDWVTSEISQAAASKSPRILLKEQITKPFPSPKTTESESCGNKAKAVIFS